MTSAELLTIDDHCRRSAYYALRYDAPALSPKDILSRAVEYGLTTDADDPGQASGDYAMGLCTDTVIDTAETDLLGLATHIAAMADLIVWIVRARTEPWVRPPAKDGWDSGAYLTQNERGLRSVALVSRLDGLTEMELRTSWAVQGECAVYGVPMDVLVVSLGSLRAGRWVNPFTVAWRHPVAKTLRFRRRDGESFGANWMRVEREHDPATREEWLDAMTEDGVLPEAIQVLHVDVPERAEETVRLSAEKVRRIRGASEPEMQPSRCFDRVRPCPFRVACPNGVSPDQAGFVSRIDSTESASSSAKR